MGIEDDIFSLLTNVGSWVLDITGFIFNNVLPAITSVITTIASQLTDITNFINNLFNYVIAQIADIFPQLNTIINIINTIVAAVVAIPQFFIDTLVQLILQIRSLFEAATRTLVPAMGKLSMSITAVSTSAVAHINTYIIAAMDILKGALQSMSDILNSIASKVVDLIEQIAKQITDTLLAIIEILYVKFRELIYAGYDGAYEAFKEISFTKVTGYGFFALSAAVGQLAISDK